MHTRQPQKTRLFMKGIFFVKINSRKIFLNEIFVKYLPTLLQRPITNYQHSLVK